MKIQLDTENKTIKLESKVKLSKLMETLEKLLPNNEWRGFSLETNTVIQSWTAPYVIREIQRPAPYWQPWYQPYTFLSNNNLATAGNNMKTSNNNLVAMHTGSNDNALQLKSGVFNIEA